MANTLTDLMPKILARGLQRLRQRLVMPRAINRDFDPAPAERGQTVNVPKPPSVTTRDVSPGVTPAAAPDITENTVPITLDQWKEAPLAFTDKDRVETIDESVQMAIDAAVDALAEDVNSSVLGLYKEVFNFNENTGTAGTTPFASNYDESSEARKILNREKAPLPDRRMVIDPAAEENAINLSEFADSSFTQRDEVIIEGDIGRKLGFDWLMDQQIPTHTAGSLTGDPTVSGAHSTGVSAVTIATDTDDTVALNEGDIINFAGDTQEYVVRADLDLGNSTSGDVSISPDLKVALSGGEAVSMAVSADHVVNLAFHRDAFALAIRPFRAPAADNAQVLTMIDDVTGLPLRLEVTRQNKQDYWSFDLLWGVKTIRPELAVRVLG